MAYYSALYVNFFLIEQLITKDTVLLDHPIHKAK